MSSPSESSKKQSLAEHDSSAQFFRSASEFREWLRHNQVPLLPRPRLRKSDEKLFSSLLATLRRSNQHWRATLRRSRSSVRPPAGRILRTHTLPPSFSPSRRADDNPLHYRRTHRNDAQAGP